MLAGRLLIRQYGVSGALEDAPKIRVGSQAHRSINARRRFWLTFLPEEERTLRPTGIHLFGLRYWSPALSGDVGRSGRRLLVKYAKRRLVKSALTRGSAVSIRRGPRAGACWTLWNSRVGLYGVQDTVGLESFDGLVESEAAIEAKPLAGVAMPLDVEAVWAVLSREKIARIRWVGKIAHDDLVYAPPVPACDYPACRLALCAFHPSAIAMSRICWPSVGWTSLAKR